VIGSIAAPRHLVTDVELSEGQARVFNLCWWDVWSDMTHCWSGCALSVRCIEEDEIGFVVKLPTHTDGEATFLFNSNRIMDVPSRVWRQHSRVL